MKAIVRSIRITPKKLNLVAKMVRNKDAVEAMEILKFTPKKSAKLLYKAIQSAVANATNNFKQNEKDLFIKEIVVTKAATMKRWLPASRGRMQPILKRNAHLRVIIGVKENNKEETKKIEKKESKKESKTATKV